MKARWIWIGASAVLVTVGVACGGDGDPPSKADFIAEAEDICRDYIDKFDEIYETAPERVGVDNPEPAVVQDFMQDIEGVYKDAVAAVRDLGLPEGDAGEEIDAALDEMERGIARVGTEIDSEEGAMEFFVAAGEEDFVEPLDEAQEMLLDVGFEVCFNGEGEE